MFREQLGQSLKNPKHFDLFNGILANALAEDVSTENLSSVILGAKLRDLGLQLGSAFVNNETAKISKLLPEYQSLSEVKTLEEVPDDSLEVLPGLTVADTVSSSLDKNTLIKLLPSSLNDAVGGGLYPGSHLTLFARPEVGKSALCMTLIRGFLKQGLKVLYCFNEDPIGAVKVRAVSCISQMNGREIQEEPDEAQVRLNNGGADNLVLVSISPGTVAQIEALIKKYEPHVVVVDQLRNIQCGEDNRVIQLEKVAQALRNLGKKYNLLMVSVTQAGDSASNKAVLTMGDIDFSNTGIPAACDILLGMGVTEEMETLNERMLTLCKNKANGVHARLPVRINPFTSTIYSV